MNASNFTNSSFEETLSCEVPQNFDNAHEFFTCYGYFFHKSMRTAILEIFLALGTTFLNILVIVLILMRPVKVTIFDKILIGHSIVDGITGIVDIPFFHINDIFGYWPLGKGFAIFWSSYDNNINTTTNLHMLYMSYARLRSILSPKSFSDELLIKHPIIVMCLIWTLPLSLWTPLIIIFKHDDFTNQTNFGSYYASIILNIALWLLPLLAILYYSIRITIILYAHTQKKKILRKSTSLNQSVFSVVPNASRITFSDSNNTSKTKKRVFNYKNLRKLLRLDAQAKFFIIIFSYWIQWIIPCIITVINPFCECVPSETSSAIYWLTYTVCITDPIVILIFNPNVEVGKKKKMTFKNLVELKVSQIRLSEKQMCN